MLPIGDRGFTGLKIDAVCANGSIVRGQNGEVLKTFSVDPAFVEELLCAFPQICFDCCTPDGMFSSGSYEMHQAGFKRDGSCDASSCAACAPAAARMRSSSSTSRSRQSSRTRSARSIAA